MYACDRGAASAFGGAADGMIEEEDALRTGNVIEDQGLDFRIVDFFDVVVVGKIFLFRRNIGDSSKCIVVEREKRLIAADVLNVGINFLSTKVALSDAFGLFLDEIVGLGAVCWGFIVIERHSDGATRYV